MVTHAKLQYYRHNYGLVCMTGLLGCRWHRYKQSTQDSRKRDLLAFTLLLLTFLYMVFYLYFILIAKNDFDDLNWYIYDQFKQWIRSYTILLAVICVIFSYLCIVMLLSLCHILHGHQLFIHPCHVVVVSLVCGLCVALTVVIQELWKTEWDVIWLSLLIIGPFLQLGAVVFMTALTWVIVRQWFTLNNCCVKLFWLLVYLTFMIGLYISPLFINSPCVAFIADIPAKPKIIAHRGASGIAPENTLVSFQLAVDKGVFGIEADVRISYDGIPFLLHDATFRRTTNIASVFPDLKDHDASYFNMSQIKQLNAGSWFLEYDPMRSVGDLSETQRQQYQNQSIPVLIDLLKQVNRSDKILLFDIINPPRSHPYYNQTVNKTIATIKQSGIKPEKIWWLTGLNTSSNQQDFTFVAQGYNQVDKLRVAGISRVNLMYSDISLSGIQEYRSSNISTNIFLVNTKWFYSLYWCMGITSVATDMCHILSPMEEPVWHLPPQSYLILWTTVDVLSAIIVITIFIVQRIQMYGSRFSPETVSLNSGKIKRGDETYRNRRSMKEKLLMTDVAADLFETDPEVEDYGIESNYTVTSTDGQILARNFHNSVSNGQYQNGRQYQTEVRVEVA